MPLSEGPPTRERAVRIVSPVEVCVLLSIPAGVGTVNMAMPWPVNLSSIVASGCNWSWLASGDRACEGGVDQRTAVGRAPELDEPSEV